MLNAGVSGSTVPIPPADPSSGVGPGSRCGQIDRQDGEDRECDERPDRHERRPPDRAPTARHHQPGDDRDEDQQRQGHRPADDRSHHPLEPVAHRQGGDPERDRQTQQGDEPGPIGQRLEPAVGRRQPRAGEPGRCQAADDEGDRRHDRRLTERGPHRFAQRSGEDPGAGQPDEPDEERDGPPGRDRAGRRPGGTRAAPRARAGPRPDRARRRRAGRGLRGGRRRGRQQDARRAPPVTSRPTITVEARSREPVEPVRRSGRSRRRPR